MESGQCSAGAIFPAAPFDNDNLGIRRTTNRLLIYRLFQLHCNVSRDLRIVFLIIFGSKWIERRERKPKASASIDAGGSNILVDSLSSRDVFTFCNGLSLMEGSLL